MPASGRGYRQQLGVAPPPPGARSPSVFATHLAALYRDGKLYAQEVAQTAAAGIAGQTRPEADVRRIAGVTASSTRKRRRTGDEVRPDTRHASRGLQRALAAGSNLPQPYMVNVKLWDAVRDECVEEAVAMLLPHELLDCIPDSQVAEFCDFDSSQEGLRHDFELWSRRVNCDVGARRFAVCGLWGDAAPYSQRDSLYLLVLTVLSGRQRVYWWLVALAKRRICQCGCQGRHTFEDIFGRGMAIPNAFGRCASC